MVSSSNHFTNSCVIVSSPFIREGYYELTYKFFLADDVKKTAVRDY
jgi:hypothetical protein